MSKLIRILLALFLVLSFVACDNPTSSSDAEVTMLPSLGGSISRAVIPSTGVDRATALYYFQTPLVYSFEDNDQGVGDGDSFTANNDVFGDVTFTISVSDSIVTYTGTDASDSIEITISYDSESKAFSLTQFMYIDDQSGVLGAPMKLFAQVKATDVPIADDGTFQGDIWAVVLADMGGSIGAQVNGVGELYHGEMTTGNVGTGVAFQDQGMSMTIPDGTNKPADAAALSNLSNMKAYMNDVGYTAFKTAATMAELNGIYYRIGQANAVECDPTDEGANPSYIDDDLNTTSDFQAYFVSKGLTSWASVTKYQ